MAEFFNRLNGVELFFLICAVIGGLFVLIRFIVMMVGLDHGVDGDIGDGAHNFDGHHADSDVGFKLLSLQGITSFLLMFGLVGMALYHDSRVGTLISMAGAVAAGLVSVWIIAKMFSLVIKLQSSGTISIDSTVGAQGKVYLTIPANGSGRVLINVHNSLREYDAVTQDKRELATGIPVRVVWVDGNVLVVEAIQ
jgi:membrane protein implicated in regulation of membrane protease activity